MLPKEFLTKALAAAKEANHVWPEFAACEAALESGWGTSRLAREANNLFGQKQGFTTAGCSSIDIRTHEVLTKKQVERAGIDAFLEPPELRSDGLYDCVVSARWPKFPSWVDSFKARMVLLEHLPSYAPALKAETGDKFIELVSKVWATDPLRGEKVLATYRAHFKNGTIV